MKLHSVLILFYTFSCSFSFSQTHFEVDSSGEYYLQDTIALVSTDSTRVGESLMKFINQENGCRIQENTSLHCSINLYKSNFLRSLDGILEYTVSFEMKKSELIYRVSDFTYTRFQRNRYGKYQKTNLIKMLSEPYPGNEVNWERYRLETIQYLQEFLNRLSNSLK